MKQLYFCVTNDLRFDQRMARICNSLQEAGYSVTLVGRNNDNNTGLAQKPYRQVRLNCFFQKGKWMYLEYNTRLFFYLLFKKAGVITAIDLDSILAVYLVSVLRRIPRVYDAHELFTEMKEVITRPSIHRIWLSIEQRMVPKFKHGYTVSQSIADEFQKRYGVQFGVIMNAPILENPKTKNTSSKKYIVYQGAVNEGRSFETLIPAFLKVNSPLFIAGDGNFMEQAKELVKKNKLEDKVIFLGKLDPAKLAGYTTGAWIGLTLFENKGLSNYYSLANRFFDYIQSGVPQLCVEYPAYINLNKKYNIAVLIKDLSPDSIADKLNKLLKDDQLYNELQANCLKARMELNWQHEEKKLVNFYQNIFNS